MLTIKVSTNFTWCMERQTPSGSGLWGDCRFLINQEVAECDFWVVFDGLHGDETTKCSRKNTLLITGEPPGVKGYDKRFLAQFGMVMTCNRSLEHNNLVFSQPALPWMIGAGLNAESRYDGRCMSYEDLAQPVSAKKRLLSVVASAKRATPGHIERSEFIEKLYRVLGNEIDVFGFGRRPVCDKWDAISPYKYHLAIENSVVPDYWTEKIADAYLGEALPIYHGCPNITDYFPAKSMICVDITDPSAAIDTIVAAIRSDCWFVNREHLLEAKRRVLYDYNFFNVIDRVARSCLATDHVYARPQTITIRPEFYFFKGMLGRLLHNMG